MDVIMNNMGYKITTEYNPKKRANPDLDYNTYYDRNKEVLLQCYYNSDRPNSITDVTCTDNNNIYEHPYELIAYKIANEYNSKILENYINI